MALATAVGSLLLASSANAATLSVDDDRTDCPTAQYTSIQAAVDAATTGDTVAVCPGNYEEGSGAIGTNALTISKSITLKGAGAGLVTISPKATTPTGGQILEAAPSIRNGIGDIIAINGSPSRPITVDVSGVTVDGYDAEGRAIAVEAGIVFLDAKGSVVRSHVTNVVTSEGDTAYNKTGGWRGAQPGIGIAQTSNALAAPVDGARLLTIDRTRVDKYNQAGILIDGATNDSAPYVASGTIDSAVITASQVIGRTECINYQGTGNCSSVGLLTTGPLFGQDGIRATNNARIKVNDTLISQNLVNGTGAPVRSTVAANGTVTANTTNNASLNLASGIRLVGAGLTSYSSFGGQVLLSYAANSNITDNAYGVINVAADGSTVRSGNLAATNGIGDVFKAENVFWGLNYYRTTNPGPAISPTDNPPVPETAVTGTSVTDPVTGLPTTASVDFSPYRSGQQADMANGEWPVLSAPLPIDDAAPTVTLGGDTTVARGSALTLAAGASDDFGVKSVTFYDGATKLGTSAGPSYTATEAIAADAACGTRAVSAVAEDSLGQTVIANGTVTVTGCDVVPTNPGGGGDTPTPPTTPTPAAPVIGAKSLTKLTASGAVLELSPAAEAGIAKVDVYLGTRKVCSLNAAPWTCSLVPTGADVGTQALRAVVTDALGRSAEASQAIAVSRFAPRGLSVKIAGKNVAGTNVRKTISARVLLPSGVTAKQGCTGGSATIVVKRAGHSVSNSEVDLKSDCTFTKSVTAKRVKAGSNAFTYSIRFTGTSVLTAVSTTRRSS
ncbi:Ig-like domain-containing protein [Baekduia sp. Peel2402]|uniref:Ig-like domain-containing protein n=1 Tax=Baekduia sp. Peel2402 TaxID=3458296 RepID=UPI00403E406C